MADMADIDQVEEAWEELARVTDVSRVIPITYMNSSAALKAFVGRHDGAVCTSSNARAVLTWALEEGRGDKVLFFPDQHLGRNTGYELGLRRRRHAGLEPAAGPGRAERPRGQGSRRLLLWKGHCSVHQRFRPEHVDGVPGRASRTGSSWCTPSAPTTWWRWPTWWARPTT